MKIKRQDVPRGVETCRKMIQFLDENKEAVERLKDLDIMGHVEGTITYMRNFIEIEGEYEVEELMRFIQIVRLCAVNTLNSSEEFFERMSMLGILSEDLGFLIADKWGAK